MIQFRTVLLIQLHYEFSSRDIPGCQEFFLCDTCIQLTVRAAHALQDRVLTAAALFLFLCAVRYSDSPDFYHHQKLYQRNCVHTKNSGYPLSRHAYKWLLYRVQLCAFGGFGSHRLKAVKRTLYTAFTPMHTSSGSSSNGFPAGTGKEPVNGTQPVPVDESLPSADLPGYSFHSKQPTI